MRLELPKLFRAIRDGMKTKFLRPKVLMYECIGKSVNTDLVIFVISTCISTDNFMKHTYILLIERQCLHSYSYTYTQIRFDLRNTCKFKQAF